MTTVLDYTREVVTRLPRRIVDGDTWWCYTDLGYRQLGYFEYRLDGWDTPEIGSAQSERERLAGLDAKTAAWVWWDEQIRAGGRRIFVHSNPDPEKYGRWLGTLWGETPAGEKFFLGEYLASVGLATRSNGTAGTRWRDTYDKGQK